MKKKLLALVLVVALAATAVIGGTLAYFTDTEKATNTFTVGNVDIKLTEDKWVQSNAKLIPGRVIEKNPTITLENDSERAYTFMEVKLSDDFAELLSKYAAFKGLNLTDAADQMELINAWFVSAVKPKIMKPDLNNKSVILGVLSPKNPGESVTYFDKVTVPADLEGDLIKEDGTYEIYITAYAIQAEGFENVNADKFAARQAAFDALFAE